jgi:hypothetical protein
MSERANSPALPKEVADKYDLKLITPATYDIPGFGIIDFTTISLAMAAKVAKKTPYLVEKKAAPTAGKTVTT